MTSPPEGDELPPSRSAPPGVDRILFGACFGLIVAACVPMALFPAEASVVVTGLYDWLAGELGLLYQWVTLAATIILAVLAFGKYGGRRLGGEGTKARGRAAA